MNDASPSPTSTEAQSDVLDEVLKWALAGHISESGITVEAGAAIRAVVAPAAVSAPAVQPTVPEGWALVPLEPTEAMLRAVFMAVRPGTTLEIARTVWQCMTRAASTPPTQPGSSSEEGDSRA